MTSFMCLPSILSTSYDLKLPIRISLLFNGANYIDSIVWKVNSSLDPDDFAARLCVDMNFPISFRNKIACQIQEQIQSYMELINLVNTLSSPDSTWVKNLAKKQFICLSIRHQNIEYTDKIQWDMISSYSTPEYFAKVTCADMGFPPEMEPAIAFQIREKIIT